jgi:hypothetical protein
MKKIISIGLLFYCNTILAQIDCEKDSAMYSFAYSYIMNESVNINMKIIVSDSIIDLYSGWFSNDLIDFPEVKERMKQYWLNKNFIPFPPFYSSCIASMFYIKDTSANSILFFSPIKDNALLVEIYSLNRYNPYKRLFNGFVYNEVSRQTTGQHYLFIFNKDSTIKNVFSHEVIHD